jgi:hypothetical protein
VVELQHYLEIKDMVYITIKVKKIVEKKMWCKTRQLLGILSGLKVEF